MDNDLDVWATMAELKELFPDLARKISVTETALGRRVTVVVGSQSTTHRTLEECMMVVRRAWVTQKAKESHV